MQLMAAFGSIGSVLAAQPVALARVLDDLDLIERLSAARAAVMEGLSEQIQRARFDLTQFALQQWIVGLFKGLRREHIHLALLDADRRLIFDEPSPMAACRA